MPLNGRQFANLAMTVAGVAMGFHSDPTKSTQYSPQIAGGNGRNVNYQIDGGDNNDDTVGGLLQLFPLEAIQEFNMITSRYKAEYGRSNGGVMNIVTKSGTNRFGGSFFTMFRDDVDERDERRTRRAIGRHTARQERLPPLPVRRVVRRPDREEQGVLLRGGGAHRRRRRSRSSTPRGLFPSQDGVYDTPMDENLFTGEVVDQHHPEPVPVGPLRQEHELAGVRRQLAIATRQLGRQHEQVQLDQRQPQLGARRQQAERVHLPVRRLRELHHGARNNPQETFPNGV